MKRLASLLVLALCLPLAAHADDASRKTKAEEIITVLHLDRMSNGVVQNAMRQTTAITQQHYHGAVPPAASASLADFQKKLNALLQPQLGWDAIKPEYARLFTTTFTEEQLDSMLAFYKSPAGQALLDKLPGIEQQVSQILQTKVQNLQPQVRQMFDDFQKNLPPATAPSSGSTPSPGTASPATPQSPGK